MRISLYALPPSKGGRGEGVKNPTDVGTPSIRCGVDGVSLSVGPLFMRCKCTKKIHAKTAFFGIESRTKMGGGKMGFFREKTGGFLGVSLIS